MPGEAVLIFNPTAGRGPSKAKLLPRVLDRFSALGMKVTPAPTQAPGDATELARQAAASGVDLAIAWGGDGTLNEVAHGLLGSKAALGVLPGGTVNVFAREAGIPFGLDEACEVIARGRRTRIAVGVAGTRPFLLMAGFGLDGAVVHRLSLVAKRGLGVSAFWLEGLKQLARYDFPPFAVRADGVTYEATSAVIGKTRLFGPGYVLTPRAGIDQDRFDVVVFRGRKRRSYLRYLAGVLAHAHTRFRDVDHFQASTVDVEAPTSVYFQLDGEPVGCGSVRVAVLRDALEVVVPVKVT